MIWIEVPVMFAIGPKRDDEIDFESLGIKRVDEPVETEQGMMIINLSRVTRINETSDKKGTIFFFSEIQGDNVRTLANFEKIKQVLKATSWGQKL